MPSLASTVPQEKNIILLDSQSLGVMVLVLGVMRRQMLWPIEKLQIFKFHKVILKTQL